MGNNFFTICSFFYSMMLSIIYFRRKHIQSLETKVYTKLVLANFMNVVFAVLCYFTILVKDYIPVVNDFVSKSLLIFYILWVFLFTFYLFVIVGKDDKKIVNKLKGNKILLIFLSIILIVLIYSLPLYYHNESNVIYSYGPSANLIYSLTAILMVVWVFVMLKDFKILKSKKCIPIILFIILAIIAVIIQKINPGLLLITAVETFITVIMFFTIENPDMKMLEEMHQAKQISDNANEEKTMFLYNMTQEIRETTNRINYEADMILDSDSLDMDKDIARNIKGETAKFSAITNDILDVSKIDAANIKIYNNKYNIKTILKEVVSVYSDICKDKGISFRTNIEHNMPDYLYGDSIGLKKSLSSILKYSINNTNNGYVELNINTIMKNDVCRLIVSVEDSSMSIKSDEIEKLRHENSEISDAYNTVILMNGTMMILPSYGVGNKFKIILDQKMELMESKNLKQYNEIYDNKRILVVDDSEAAIKIVEKLLKNSNVLIDSVNNGKHAIDKIKNKTKYDMILLDEELSQITGVELIKKFKEIRNFNIPVILLTKDSSYEYNQEYINQGFNDYIIKPLKKEILLEKLDKFMNK